MYSVQVAVAAVVEVAGAGAVAGVDQTSMIPMRCYCWYSQTEKAVVAAVGYYSQTFLPAVLCCWSNQTSPLP